MFFLFLFAVLVFLEIDECACGYSGCLHQCTDLDPATDSTNRRFVCSCNVGYDLLNDFNCIGWLKFEIQFYKLIVFFSG